MARLPNYMSCFSTELYGIYYALKSVDPNIVRNVIYTDSYNAITALLSVTTESNGLVLRINHILSKQPANQIALEWLPNHTGIGGNEAADELAKTSLKLSNHKCSYDGKRHETQDWSPLQGTMATSVE